MGGLWTRVVRVTRASYVQASLSGVYPGAAVRPPAPFPVPSCGVLDAKSVPALRLASRDDEPE